VAARQNTKSIRWKKYKKYSDVELEHLPSLALGPSVHIYYYPSDVCEGKTQKKIPATGQSIVPFIIFP
jgi:hypothetical protein